MYVRYIDEMVVHLVYNDLKNAECRCVLQSDE
jgi:hypothetical protein